MRTNDAFFGARDGSWMSPGVWPARNVPHVVPSVVAPVDKPIKPGRVRCTYCGKDVRARKDGAPIAHRDGELLCAGSWT